MAAEGSGVGRTRGLCVGRTRACVGPTRGSAPTVLLILTIACGARDVLLPSGAGVPLPDFAAAYDAATASCRGVRTLTAAMGVSGRSGSTRLRGRIHAGLEAPASLRIEGLAPFGAPGFILVARDSTSTLLLPRDDRFVRDAPPEAIVEAITGLSLTPGDLRAILTGCLVSDAAPHAGRSIGDQWRVMDLGRDATAYLKRSGGEWSIVAGTIASLRVDYDDRMGGFPRRIRLRAERDSRPTDLTLAVSDLEVNTPLDPQTFTVQVPASATSMTLEELRDGGPLRAPK